MHETPGFVASTKTSIPGRANIRVVGVYQHRKERFRRRIKLTGKRGALAVAVWRSLEAFGISLITPPI